MSPGDFSARDERDHLQSVWVDFLDRSFRNDADAAAFFDVDESTIRHWKGGRNGVNGVRLYRAARRFPTLRQMLFGDA